MRHVLRGLLLSIAAAVLVAAASPALLAKGKSKVPVCRDEKCCDKRYGGTKIKDNVSQKLYDKCVECVKEGKPYAGDLDECGK
jgi:hypothetical protein